MKNIFKQALIVSAISSLCLVPLSAQAAGNGDGSGGQQNQQNQQSTTQQNDQNNTPVVDISNTLNQVEIDYLLLMHEEEKVARDVYLTLYEQWQVRTFSNIAGAEQNHMDQVKAIMDAYQLEDIALAERGQFENAELQTLYDDLISKGSESEQAAILVGALVEEVDIKDLQLAIAATTNTSLITMYTNLLLASEQHLRAFVGRLGQTVGTYTAQVLPQAEVDRILKSEAAEDHAENSTSTAAMVLDVNTNNRTETNASYSVTLSNGQNAVTDFSQTDNANLMVKWNIATQDQQQQADTLIIAMHQANANAPLLAWAKTPTHWQAWTGDLTQIPTHNTITLGQNLSIAALSNLSLTGLQGTLLIYTAYRIGSRLVAQSQPVQFQVN